MLLCHSFPLLGIGYNPLQVLVVALFILPLRQVLFLDLINPHHMVLIINALFYPIYPGVLPPLLHPVLIDAYAAVD